MLAWCPPRADPYHEHAEELDEAYPRMLLKYSLIASLLLAVFLVACGDSNGDEPSVFEQAFATDTPEPETVVEATATPVPPTAEATATAVPPTEAPPAPTATRVPPTVVQPTPRPTVPAGPPSTGRWIDVNVSTYTVSLMDGQSTIQAIGPVGVGREIDSGAWESTRTGLYFVHSFNKDLVYDAPYDTYISHWVGFDAEWANGFHSFLKDEDGKIVDDSTGMVSNGCIRTGSPEVIYEFAESGMPVWVHT